MKQQFIVNTADTFKTYIFENNRKLSASEARITVYKPGSSTVLIDNESMSLSTDGLLSYALTSIHNAEAGLNYKAVITYTHESETDQATLFYDVVNSRLSKVITDDDIVAELPQLKDNGWRTWGFIEAGSVSTIVDSGLKRYEDDFFTGGLAYLPNSGETREITGFTSTTGTVLVAAFTSAPVAGDRYLLVRPFSREIQRAFEKIEDRLTRLGKRPHLVLDPYDLKEVHVYFSVAEACKGLAAGQEGFWWSMWKEYEKKALDAFDSLNLKYDRSSDGFVSRAESETVLSKRRAVRG